MAQTFEEIVDAMDAAVAADPTLGALLTSTSNVAIWKLWNRVTGDSIQTLEELYDDHKAEVAGIIGEQKPHTLQWYATMAKAFQYGASLPADSDVYDPVAAPGDASLIVTYAAAVELVNIVRIKVATGSAGSLAALSSPQLTAFTAYMAKVKDAGVRLQCTSGAGDNFQPAMVIYYDPLVLDSTGARLDGTAATPVQDAVNAFLDSLPFNGVFILNSYIAAMQAVEGVIIADVQSVQANYGSTPYVVIDVQYVPDAGYLVLDAGYFGTNVSYEAYTV